MFTSFSSLSDGEGKQKRDCDKSLINEKLLGTWCIPSQSPFVPFIAHILRNVIRCWNLKDASSSFHTQKKTVVSFSLFDHSSSPPQTWPSSKALWWLAAKLNFLPFRPETSATNLIVSSLSPRPFLVLQ